MYSLKLTPEPYEVIIQLEPGVYGIYFNEILISKVKTHPLFFPYAKYY